MQSGQCGIIPNNVVIETTEGVPYETPFRNAKSNDLQPKDRFQSRLVEVLPMTQPSRPYRRNLFDLPAVAPETVSTRGKTLGFFKSIMDTAPKDGPDSPIRLAMGVAVDAYKRKAISWKQLATLLLHNVQFVELYHKMVITPNSLVDDLVSPDGTERDIDPSKWRASEEKFISRLRYISDILNGKVLLPRLGWDYELEGKSLSYWMRGGRVERQASWEDAVAEAYEKELQQDPLFKEDFANLIRIVDVPCWRYGFRTNRFSPLDANYSKSTQPTAKANAEKINAIRYFCVKWCVEHCEAIGELSTEPPKFGFRAMRISIRINRDSTGLTIFIPRFYGFSHIKNYQNKDFRDLKSSLDQVFEPYRKRADRKTVKELIKDAKAIKSDLQNRGISKRDAWEQTRKHMAWSHSTMQSRLGIQPK